MRHQHMDQIVVETTQTTRRGRGRASQRRMRLRKHRDPLTLENRERPVVQCDDPRSNGLPPASGKLRRHRVATISESPQLLAGGDARLSIGHLHKRESRCWSRPRHGKSLSAPLARPSLETATVDAASATCESELGVESGVLSRAATPSPDLSRPLRRRVRPRPARRVATRPPRPRCARAGRHRPERPRQAARSPR